MTFAGRTVTPRSGCRSNSPACRGAYATASAGSTYRCAASRPRCRRARPSQIQVASTSRGRRWTRPRRLQGQAAAWQAEDHSHVPRWRGAYQYGPRALAARIPPLRRRLTACASRSRGPREVPPARGVGGGLPTPPPRASRGSTAIAVALLKGGELTGHAVAPISVAILAPMAAAALGRLETGYQPIAGRGRVGAPQRGGSLCALRRHRPSRGAPRAIAAERCPTAIWRRGRPSRPADGCSVAGFPAQEGSLLVAVALDGVGGFRDGDDAAGRRVSAIRVAEGLREVGATAARADETNSAGISAAGAVRPPTLDDHTTGLAPTAT